MATVTGLTKERMLEIEAESVVGGVITAGHLILERHDATTIDAGSVIGPTGPTGPAAINVVTSSTRPGSPTDGLFIYETDTDRVYVWNGAAWISLGMHADPPACRVYHNANQSITDNTVTTLAFNSERYDTDTMHDTVTNNGRITFNKAGLYIVDLNIETEAYNDITLLSLIIRLNGATTLARQSIGTSAQVVENIGMSMSTVYKFAAADYVEARFRHKNNVAAARNVLASGNYSPEFSATWLGRG